MKKATLKAISTNTKDMKTGILLEVDSKGYLFNIPDYFQRTATSQKMKFYTAEYIFLSRLMPNYFAGFPGFYMSARESLGGNKDV